MKGVLFAIPLMAAAGAPNADDFRTSRDAAAKALASAAAVLAIEETDVVHWKDDQSDALCESLRIDIRLDRGAARMDATVCQAAQGWSIREWSSR